VNKFTQKGRFRSDNNSLPMRNGCTLREIKNSARDIYDELRGSVLGRQQPLQSWSTNSQFAL